MKNKLFKQPLLSCLIFIIPGGCIFIFGLYLLFQAEKSNSWPSAPGIIKTSDVDDSESGCKAKVTFEYMLNNKIFTGNKIRTVELYCSNPSYAQEDLKHYPAGAKVKVYFSPTDPADCILEPGIHPSNWFFPLLGCGFIVGPSIMIFLLSLYRRKIEEQITSESKLMTESQ